MHSPFAASPLVRLLGRWAPVEADACADPAERLSAWFGPLDAIRLQSVHQAVGAPADGHGGVGKGLAQHAQAMAADVQRVRGVLANAIAKDPLALAGIRATDDEDPGYAPWRQRHLDLQRQMAQMVGALRDHVRQRIARLSPRLRQLATLDAAFQQLLDDRHDALQATTAALLERRHAQMRAAQRQACESEGRPDEPVRWREPGGWLAAFANDWRQALLAELDLRLEPVMGLLGALRQEPDTSP